MTRKIRMLRAMTNLHFIAEKAKHRYEKVRELFENEINCFSERSSRNPKSLLNERAK